MAYERLPTRFSLRSQLWFRWTGKCFETATSHMQTVVCHYTQTSQLMDKIEEIDFFNRQNPTSSFDFVRIEDVLQTENKHHSSFEYHTLKFYAILFITSGNDTHFIDFESYKCKKGNVLLIGNGQTHKFSENKNLEGYILVFKSEFLAHILTLNETTNVLQIFNTSLFEPKIELDNNQFIDIFNRIENIKKEYIHNKDNFTKKILGGEVYTLLSLLFRKSRAVKNTFLDAKYLATFLSFQELLKNQIFSTTKVFDYAKSLGVSTKTLNNITKNIMGKQTKTYINEYYLLCVKRILIDKKLSIKECAFQAGFDDIPNFYKFIRKHLNQTPEQFRENF